MNEASKQRLRIAHRIAPVYAAHSGVCAVMVGGSVARGHADHLSDLELGIFWQAPPTDSDRLALMQQAGGVACTLDPFDTVQQRWIEDYLVGPLSIDIVHQTVAATDGILNAVLRKFDTARHKHALLAALQHSIPLSGGALIHGWQAQLVDYPAPLQAAVLRAALALKPWWHVEVAAERGSVIRLHQALCQAGEQLLVALLAMSKQYDPGSKWLPQLIANLTLTPDNLGARFQRCFDAPFIERPHLMRALIEDVFDLAAGYLAQNELTSLRAVLRQQRTPVLALDGR